MAKIKTFKQFEKNGEDFETFLKPLDQIDWELYEHILCGYVAPNFSDVKFGQNGECSKSENGTDYYQTVITIDEKYYYMGDMPSFNPSVYYSNGAEDFRYSKYS